MKLVTWLLANKILAIEIFPLTKKDFIYLFLERREGKEKEGEKHQCVVASCMPPIGGPGPQPRHAP